MTVKSKYSAGLFTAQGLHDDLAAHLIACPESDYVT